MQKYNFVKDTGNRYIISGFTMKDDSRELYREELMMVIKSRDRGIISAQ